MKHVTDVMNSAATEGDTTYLKDTVNLIQLNEVYERGTLWIRSGTHAGKVLRVNSHANNKLIFTALTGAIATGTRYAVARGLYPFEQVVAKIESALDETYVTAEDHSLTGDGEALTFTLPAGVFDILRVEIERENHPTFTSNHWHEIQGSLRFDYGHAPFEDDVIHIYYKAKHDELSTYSDEISTEINIEWLVLTTARELLFWGADMYGLKAYMIEDRINKVLGMLKGKTARIGGPTVRMKSGGSSDYSSLTR
jgi:hypothetical protein